MGLGSLLFGKKPKKQKPTAQERAQSLSAARDMRRLEDKFFPLQEQVAEESNKDFTAKLSGRASAETALAERDAHKSLLARTLSSGNSVGGNTFTHGANEIADHTASAYTEGQTSARTGAMGMQDARKLGVTGLAYGLASEASRGMSTASRLATDRALTRLRAKQQIDTARSKMIGQIAGSAMASAGSGSGGGGAMGGFDQQKYSQAMTAGKGGAGAYASIAGA